MGGQASPALNKGGERVPLHNIMPSKHRAQRYAAQQGWLHPSPGTMGTPLLTSPQIPILPGRMYTCVSVLLGHVGNDPAVQGRGSSGL